MDLNDFSPRLISTIINITNIININLFINIKLIHFRIYMIVFIFQLLLKQ